jgi:DNA-directed RNA polymerase specialized sigma24 family protein
MDLTPEAFDKLLASLDSDRDEAGRKYVDLLRKLARFLGYWGCSAPQDQADDALSRTAARIVAGEQIENLQRYTLGVAHLVYKESVRHEISRRNAMKPAEENTDQAAEERRARCYARCFHGLPSEEQELITRYYSGHKAPDREALAKHRGISLNSLRVSAFRIRQKLARCLEECLKQQPEM